MPQRTMDTRTFEVLLRERFSKPRDPGSADQRLAPLVAEIPGMSTLHALTVLSMAVSHLRPPEIYVEVGTYRGRSLVGALALNPQARGVGIENFGEFAQEGDARDRIARALDGAAVAHRAHVTYGDAFAILARDQFEGPVGVYFYDGVHSAAGQYAGLGLAERHLADEALVIVDDTSWPQVREAVDRYVRRHPGYQLLAEFPALTQDDPVWCNGMRVYRWIRPPRWTPPGRDVVLRGWLQSRVTGPLRTLAWRHLSGHPKALSAIRRLVTRGRTSVAGSDGGKAR